MSLISNLLGRKKSEREAMLVEYVSIMSRADKPNKGDEDRLEVLMVGLGLSISDVEADAEQFREQSRLQASLDSYPTLVAEQKRLQALRDAAKAEVEKAQKAMSEISYKIRLTEVPMSASANAHTGLKALRDKNPRLIGKDWK